MPICLSLLYEVSIAKGKSELNDSYGFFFNEFLASRVQNQCDMG